MFSPPLIPNYHYIAIPRKYAEALSIFSNTFQSNPKNANQLLGAEQTPHIASKCNFETHLKIKNINHLWKQHAMNCIIPYLKLAKILLLSFSKSLSPHNSISNHNDASHIWHQTTITKTQSNFTVKMNTGALSAWDSAILLIVLLHVLVCKVPKIK